MQARQRVSFYGGRKGSLSGLSRHVTEMVVDVLDFDEEDEEDYIDSDTFDSAQMLADMHRKNKRRKAICRAVILAVFIATIVGLSIGISSSSSHEVDGDDWPIDVEILQRNSPTNSSDSGILNLPYPPGDLVKQCAPDSVRTAPGHDECLKLCEASACCELPPDNILSCIEGNEDTCAAYGAICINLHLPVFDVKHPCSPTSLETDEGILQCTEACGDAPLCCSAPESVLCQNESISEKCSLFGPCPTLSTKNSTRDSSNYGQGERRNTTKTFEGFILQNACGSHSLATERGKLECKSLCKSHLCCFAKNPADNCRSGQEEECLRFDVCSGLL